MTRKSFNFQMQGAVHSFCIGVPALKAEIKRLDLKSELLFQATSKAEFDLYLSIVEGQRQRGQLSRQAFIAMPLRFFEKQEKGCDPLLIILIKPDLLLADSLPQKNKEVFK